MVDKITEDTHTSWSSRIGASLKGLAVGLILIIVGVVLLFWNEGRTIKTYQALKESQRQVISINAQEPAAGMNGKLVHISGEAIGNQSLADDVLPVKLTALKLQRYVETYQWEETKQSEETSNMGGDADITTTYTYEKVWREGLIDSSGFKHPDGHKNPSDLPYFSQIWTADKIYIGQYLLSESHKYEIDNFQSLSLPENIVLPGHIKKINHKLYTGDSQDNPKIGDQRIEFHFIPEQSYSAVGKLNNSELAEHTASNGRTIALLQPGIHTADAMFEQAQRDNTMLAWILRGVGALVLILAFNMILKPLAIIADVVPLIGRVVSIGTGMTSFLLGLTLAIGTISIAWIFYRPLIGLLLFAAAAGLVYWLKRKSTQAAIKAPDNNASVIAE